MPATEGPVCQRKAAHTPHALAHPERILTGWLGIGAFKVQRTAEFRNREPPEKYPSGADPPRPTLKFNQRLKNAEGTSLIINFTHEPSYQPKDRFRQTAAKITMV